MVEKPQTKFSTAENFALGGAAAIICISAPAPIERVKLLLQNQNAIIKAGRLSEPYKGIIDCAVRTYHSEGVLPFWRGNLANCIRQFPTQALNFALKEKMKSVLKTTDSFAVKFTKNIAAGSCAGAVSLVLLYSLAYAQTRLANDVLVVGKMGGERQFNGLVDVYKKTLKSDGVVGLYRGFVISCVGIVVYRGLYFGLYDTLKPTLLGKDAGLGLSLGLGFLVTVIAGLACYPMDTIRTRMMMTSGEAVKYKGPIDCFVKIVKNEGAMFLMKGAGASILRGVAGAGTLAGFDKCKALYVAWRLA